VLASDHSTLPEGPVSAGYGQLVATGALRDDPQQRGAAHVLDAVTRSLGEDTSGGFMGRLFRRPPAPVKGVYLVGDVGRGKTMLMDLFFEAAPTRRKRRVHFHEFMDEVHEKIAQFRAVAKSSGDDTDPVAAVAGPLADDIRLLCLDEFHVNDITNAMLLGRLFEHLFGRGVVLVATSNVSPDRLYENGLNRQLFLPFISLLEQRTAVVSLNGPTDYRRLKFEGEQVFQFGPPEQTGPQMEKLWLRLTGGIAGQPGSVQSLGRTIPVPRTAMGAARFSATNLLDSPLGARDFLRIAQAFDTVMIENISAFDRTRSDASKRFILLIDTLYDRGVRLAASFAVPLEQLGADDKTRFEFARTVSRLIEMSSEDYLNNRKQAHTDTNG